MTLKEKIPTILVDHNVRVDFEAELVDAILQAFDEAMEEIIGANNKPSTWVQRYPGTLAPGTKRSTKLAEWEKQCNRLRAEQRARKAAILGTEEPSST